MLKKYYFGNVSVNGAIVNNVITSVWFFQSPKVALSKTNAAAEELGCIVQDFKRIK